MENFLGLPFWFWRLLLAAVLAGIIGFERQLRGRAAGLRTHILVCLGATLITLAGVLLAESSTASSTPGIRGPIYMDSARIAAGVITGIGFLGAGAIIRTGDVVRGLTTAASIWFTAGLGVIIGFGFMTVAITATCIVLITLIGLVYLEDRIPPRYYRMLIVVGEGIGLPNLEQACHQVLNDRRIKIRETETEMTPQAMEIRLVFHLQLSSVGLRTELLNRLSVLPGIRHVAWKRLP